MGRMRVAVLCGGPSAEREVSLESGMEAAAALSHAGHDVALVEMFSRPPVRVRDCHVAFIAAHGSYGEDGRLQRDLERAGVAYTGSDSLSSRLAFDKIESKRAFERARVKTPPWMVVDSQSGTAGAKDLTFPVVVKPAASGSSLGVSVARTRAELASALRSAFSYDLCAIVERYVPGRELTVGILGEEVLPVVEIIAEAEFFDYAAKYEDERTKRLCPAPLERDEEREAKAAALEAFCALGCGDFGRVDLILDSEGAAWVLEVNTIPGLTRHSLFPLACAEAGIPMEEMTDRLVMMASARRRCARAAS